MALRAAHGLPLIGRGLDIVHIVCFCNFVISGGAVHGPGTLFLQFHSCAHGAIAIFCDSKAGGHGRHGKCEYCKYCVFLQFCDSSSTGDMENQNIANIVCFYNFVISAGAVHGPRALFLQFHPCAHGAIAIISHSEAGGHGRLGK